MALVHRDLLPPAVHSRFAGRILSVGDTVIRRWGVISGTAKRRTGHSPPVIDTLFAATALEHDLYLVTRNVRDDPANFPLSPVPRSLL